MLLNIAVICLAACVGALMRWGFALWLNPGGLIPWGTLAVNLIGGYCIGIALAVFTSRPDIDPAWRLLVVTGFLGTLTTFSSFSGEVVSMLMQQRFGLAFGTIALHLGGSLALTWAGMRSALWWLAR
ncbi:fluoride efflux transporter CrcB [Paracidovorax cattleyae]|uniref:Fluoride-specific ion channel FluC n=1 Tax=Paracidovorax cattleyae TaxID=80868 RepID=A0A1H0UXB7_9BURK|nr:fluoride efflux transporter CrcB [Paracidovorax cattleyae]AVS74080.1 fluoride efflux transporter CrcB [Paracidovorax cattleyae]MBF9266370.1 fluoride efflux transporter CrcB [Paracidovorax cattleyae]SDP70790.1 camphor resistance protein CrcB [Paracidovorax cattleyae]